MLPNTCTTSSGLDVCAGGFVYSLPSRSSQRFAQKSSTASGSMHRESSQPMKTGSAPT